jgi:CheY-like chemotaxis protein
VIDQKIVLYADDDADDKTWIVDACRTTNSFLQITFVNNGKDVIRFLKDINGDRLPSLIVLDLNMPEMDGKQTLRFLKSEPSLRNIPVAVVTTSSSKLDVEVCKKLGASIFLTKPDTFAEWQDLIRQLEPFV